MDLVIWHNPRCSKSRQTLALLEERGLAPRILHYLDTPPDAAAIARVLDMLNMTPRDLMRRKESAYADAGLDDPGLARDDLIAAMVENPILIERPVVIHGDRAAIGRPPDAVLDIL